MLRFSNSCFLLRLADTVVPIRDLVVSLNDGEKVFSLAGRRQQDFLGVSFDSVTPILFELIDLVFAEKQQWTISVN